MQSQDKNLFLGIDMSTQSCKVIVIDYDQKNIIFNDSLNYDKELPQFQTKNGARQNVAHGVSESSPDMWVEALHILFTKVSKELNKNNQNLVSCIKTISVSGQQHGLVTLQKNGDLSRPYSKLWNDFSTAQEVTVLTEKIGGNQEMIKEIGNKQTTGYTAAKIFHLVRNEPENYAKTETIFLVHNYINWILTGGSDGGVSAFEPGDTSGSALWNPTTRQWSQKVIETIDKDLMRKLPKVSDSREFIGKIGKNFVEKYGFSKDCQIASGSGDNMMSAIVFLISKLISKENISLLFQGTGNIKDGIVTISLGTSGTIYTCMKESFIDPDGDIVNFCDATGNYLPLICLSNLANGYEETRQLYNLTYEQYEDIVKSVKVGSEGKIICPWWTGERTPYLPNATPVYFGWQTKDFTKERICRSVVESHILHLYECFKKLPILTSEIRLTGGISKSKFWRTTIANIFNCSVVPVQGEGAVLGAALHAAWSHYKNINIDQICNGFVTLLEEERINPNKEDVEVYEYLKKMYIGLSRRVRGQQTDINPFEVQTEFFKKFNC